jgi:hypothetical protein
MPWLTQAPAASRSELWPMSGVQAGVVAQAQVEGLPSAPTRNQILLSQPATWSHIWVVLALAYLVGIYLGMIRVERRG